ncbi:MAG TPA: histidine triad nucleotide-binding protein [Ruminococcaceae bacterium]|nr:histidine triad nucleotide-binding protein [Oscillospiraceae bacterium]
MDCIFCKIVAGEIPSKKLYEDDKVIAFYDIEPQAPVHFLVIPKEHILTCANDVNEQNSEIIAHIFVVIAKLAKQLELSNGYRIINNCGDDAGQTVKHMHFHVLAKRNLSLTMG